MCGNAHLIIPAEKKANASTILFQLRIVFCVCVHLLLCRDSGANIRYSIWRSFVWLCPQLYSRQTFFACHCWLSTIIRMPTTTTTIRLIPFFLYSILGTFNAVGITVWGAVPIESAHTNHAGKTFARTANQTAAPAKENNESGRRLCNW